VIDQPEPGQTAKKRPCLIIDRCLIGTLTFVTIAYGSKLSGSAPKVSVRRAPPNGGVFGALVSTIDSGHLGAFYGGEAEEAALAG